VDRTAFQTFYDETASGLRAYLRLRCRDATLADDLLQDTYLRLLRGRLPELAAAQLKSYLYKTAHSVLVDHYRARQREKTLHDQDASTRSDELAGDENIVALDGLPAVGPLELPLDMERVFGALQPRQQTLLWLAYVEGFKHTEIAEVIGVNSASVRVLLSRARAELAARLDAQDSAPAAALGVKR